MSAPRREGVTTALILTTLVVFLAGAIAAIKLSGRDDGADVRPVTSGQVRTMVPISTSLRPTTTTVTTTPPTTTAKAGLIPVDATGANPLTAIASLATRPCRLPTWNDTAPQPFLDAALECLNQAWQPVMGRLRLPFRPATVVTTPDVSAQSCGRPPEESSYYCDGVIYLVPASYLGTNAGPQGVSTAAVSMMAHEYGHHLQQLSGTLPAALKQITAVGWGSPQGLELSRRTELQAQCLSGMFMGTAFDVGSLRLAQQDNYTRGDAPGMPPNHGAPQNYGEWFSKGVQRNSLVSCNTWVAQAPAVG